MQDIAMGEKRKMEEVTDIILTMFSWSGIKVYNPLVPADSWLTLTNGVEGVEEGDVELLHPQRRHHVDLDLVTKAKGHQRSVEGVLENMEAFLLWRSYLPSFQLCVLPNSLGFLLHHEEGLLYTEF